MNASTIISSVVTGLLFCLSSVVGAQTAYYDRLPSDVLDIMAPSSRVIGAPGSMHIQNRSCRSFPTTEVRPRIVNTAVQEWAYFGFGIQDQTQTEVSGQNSSTFQRRRPRMSAEEAERVADSIGGYWAAAPDSNWILQRQNDSWNSRGLSSRWRNPWSAAFISWVMCESGLEDDSRFERAVAHHTYIDQAILAREQDNPDSAYIAYAPGEMPIMPGDLLCRGSRPAYKTIAERRQHLGVGARTHCDIVVKTDEAENRIMVIGGNVRSSVTMKLLPATHEGNGHFKPAPYRGRTIFAHLKLNADPVSEDALSATPTFKSMVCSDQRMPVSLLTANLLVAPPAAC
jgi:hypothetical protein